MDEVAILVAADDNYAMPMTVALHSALDHLDREIHADVFIVDTGISAKNRKKATEILARAHPSVTLHWPTQDLSEYTEINVGAYSMASLVRLFAAELAPDDCERLLYLDSDLVVDDDLSQLWDIDLTATALMACVNLPGGQFNALIRDKFPSVQAPDDAEYFNAGVLLINVPEWKKQQIGPRALKFLKENNGQLSFPDQDALNAVMAGQWAILAPRWNRQVHGIGRGENITGITHYTSFKPWRAGFRARLGGKFLKAYLRTGWDHPLKAWLWAANRLLGHFIYGNFIRAKRRLGIVG